LSVCVGPGATFRRSKVLLARAHFSGTLELLTAAWERLLGYEPRELAGMTLRQLMVLAAPVSARAVDAILDEVDMGAVILDLRCKDGRIRTLKLHRRLDPHERKVYLVADETLDTHADDRGPSAS